MENIYIIGDIHGCCKSFKYLVQEKIRLTKSDILYCLGDYIDRGPDSKGVIDFILELRNKGYTIRTLRGNHEQMMMDSGRDIDALYLWIDNGGEETLKSFGIDSVLQLDAVYSKFLEETELYIATKDFILVHAGLNFDVPNPLDDEKSMIWIRKFSVDEEFMGKRILIHGHTPVSKEYILAQKSEGVINLDGGCVYKNHQGLGNLFAFNFTNHQFVFTQNMD